MEEARPHPTGRHWVDILLKPTLFRWYLNSLVQVTFTMLDTAHGICWRCAISCQQKLKLTPVSGAHVCHHSDGC